MHIGIIGAGKVGAALGQRWAQLGHTVLFGSRDPASEKLQDLVRAAGPQARAVTQPEAAAASDVIVLATPWPATQAALAALGDLRGKILLDATNPFKNGQLELEAKTSAGEQVADWAAGARVVKVFNTTGSGNMANADYGALRPAMFLCGDDAAAKQTAAQLAEALGFEAIDSGPLLMARNLEALTGLWVQLAARQGLGPNIAFALLRR